MLVLWSPILGTLPTVRLASGSSALAQVEDPGSWFFWPNCSLLFWVELQEVMPTHYPREIAPYWRGKAKTWPGWRLVERKAKSNGCYWVYLRVWPPPHQGMCYRPLQVPRKNRGVWTQSHQSLLDIGMFCQRYQVGCLQPVIQINLHRGKSWYREVFQTYSSQLWACL